MQDIKTLYQSTTLAVKLERLRSFPLTALVAPVGYGKSTALQVWLGRKPAIWTDCRAGESLTERFAAQLSGAEDLFAAVAEIADGTVLVFENYHLCAGETENDAFLQDLLILLRGRCPVVLLSRRDAGLTRDSELLLHGMLYRIEEEDFLLNAAELQQWYASCGLPLTAEQAQHLETYTEGWAAMCYLALLQYSRTGSLTQIDSGALMETIYTRLPENGKRLLWYLCEAVEFSDEDVVMLWGSRDGLALAQQLRDEGVPLTHRDGVWRLHAMFAAYARQQMETLNDTNRSSVQRRLGRWYQSRGEDRKAAAAFEAAGDWDQLLTLLEEDAGASMSFSYAEQVTRLMLLCPKEVLSRHPLAQFYHARQLAALGRPELVQRWRPADEGQAAMVDLQTVYPELEQMVRCCRSAREQGAKLPPTWREPFTLGRLTLLGAYHRSEGQVETTLKYLEEYLNLYVPLSGGHGAGALEAIRAEHAYLRGEIEDAQISAHSAQLIARENRQNAVQMTALFTLLRCACMEGRRDEARQYLSQLRERAGRSELLQQTAVLAENWYLAIRCRAERCEDWIREGNGAVLELMPPAWADFYVVSAFVMLRQGEWTRVIANCQRWLGAMQPWYSDLSALYLRLCLTAAYTALDKPDEAQTALQEALRLAAPNGWIAPFAELWPELEHWSAQLPASIPALAERMRQGSAALQQQLQLAELSQRENQVAQLIRSGCSNQQIANRLGISINTVKTTIRHINAKLRTSDRSSLIDRLERI